MTNNDIKSTIVEILYSYTPGHGIGRTRTASTIVEILYSYTPRPPRNRGTVDLQ